MAPLIGERDPGWTLRATHDDGRDLYFVDYVPEGATVDLWADPEAEEGFKGTCVVYKDGDEWRARPLTEAEREERCDRLLKQALDKSLPREERLRDPAADAGRAD